ncbi:MAG: peptidoglycan DD-metalloendopeptidase family protein [Bacteroidia bacterium]|nr:peptidoglycan DD-metalloendopeptidase family protein [Bacteroidia bacterium]
MYKNIFSKINFRFFSLLLICLTAFSLSVSAQSKKELERRRENLQKEIEQTGKKLDETKKIKTGSLNQLLTLNKRIRAREELINVITSEINSLDSQIGESNSDISTLQQKLDALKSEYANTIRYAYRNRNAYEIMMFLFSSSDFNQAYKRMLFLRQYGEFRKKQRDDIVITQSVLTNRVNVLADKKTSKEKLLGIQQQEKQKLTGEKKQQEKIVSNMNLREKKLRSELKEKQKSAEKLSRAIEDLIRRETEAARKRANAAGKKNPANASVFTLTPEAKKLSSDFENNKGSLPWPVEQGIITGDYGKHQHPLWKDVYTNNNGIDISTAKNAEARCVFNGKVSSVFSIPGAGKAVIVRHGEFLTVYSNLNDVFVNAGDNVSTKQRIGNMITDSDEGKTELHLEIWRGNSRMNPEDWIARR